jgi:hypothetical protein
VVVVEVVVAVAVAVVVVPVGQCDDIPWSMEALRGAISMSSFGFREALARSGERGSWQRQQNPNFAASRLFNKFNTCLHLHLHLRFAICELLMCRLELPSWQEAVTYMNLEIGYRISI